MLSVLRGLEALDQPSRVTLHTSSRYVLRGFRYGLPAWRLNNWRWEKFGVMEPVSNCDLWQRVDRAMQYHQVRCHIWKPVPASRQDNWLSPAEAEPHYSIPELRHARDFDPHQESEDQSEDQSDRYDTYSERGPSMAPQSMDQSRFQRQSAMAERAGMFQPRQQRVAVA